MVLLYKVAQEAISMSVLTWAAHPSPVIEQEQDRKTKDKRQEFKKTIGHICAPTFASLIYLASLADLQLLLHKVTLSHINEEIVDMAALGNPTCPSYHPSSTSGTPRNKMIVRRRESSCFPAG